MRFTHTYAAAAVAFFLRGVPVSEARTSRAKRWEPSDPQAFQVELGFDPVGRYVATIGMGKPYAHAGNFSFLLSTCAPYTGVAAADCESCAAQIGEAPVYNISKSSSASQLDTTQTTFSIGGGSMSGAIITEDCSLRKIKSSGWAYDNQTIVLIQKTEGMLGKNVSGFVGFGRSTGNASYVSGIINSQGWKNATFAFAFNRYNASSASQSAGSLTVREVNPNLFTGDINWQSLAQVTDVPKTMPTDWSINFNSYSMAFGSQITNGSGGVAIIEPYFQEIRLPNKEALDFFNGISGAKMTNDSMSLSWEVPCDQQFTLSITILENTYRMKNKELVNSTGTVCTSLVKAWADPTIRAYVFGAPFTASAYIVYNAHQDQSSDQIGTAPRPQDADTIVIINQGVPGEVLVAAIVGSVCGVGLAATVIFFFLYRRKQEVAHTRKTLTKKPDDGKFKVEPFTGEAQPNSATPILSVSTRQSGYILEHGLIGGERSEGSETKQGSLRSPYSQHSHAASSTKEPIVTPNLILITEPSVPSPQSSPGQDPIARPLPPVSAPLPPVSASLPRSFHSFYGERVPSVVIAAGPASPVLPPPYFTPSSSLRRNR